MVNSGDKPVTYELEVPGISLPKQAGAWTIQNDDPEAYNVPGQDPDVTIVESDYALKKHRVEVRTYSVKLLKFVL